MADPSAPDAGDGRIHLRPDALDWREVEGEVVALDRNDATYLAVNRTGATLWPALARGTTRRELVSVLLERFEVGPERAEADVDAFLADLRRRDLIEP